MPAMVVNVDAIAWLLLMLSHCALGHCKAARGPQQGPTPRLLTPIQRREAIHTPMAGPFSNIKLPPLHPAPQAPPGPPPPAPPQERSPKILVTPLSSQREFMSQHRPQTDLLLDRDIEMQPAELSHSLYLPPLRYPALAVVTSGTGTILLMLVRICQHRALFLTLLEQRPPTC